MADDRAVELLAIFDREWNNSESANFRNIYQEVADVMFPRENQISTTRSPGATIGREIIEITGLTASIDNVAGLSINLFPPGDKFYNVLMSDDELNKIDAVKRKLGQMTEISHEKRANSNFMLQANETIRSLATLGTGCMFSDYIPEVGLNYTDYDIGTYVFLENDLGLVDTVMLKFPFTAKQAFQRWKDKAGKTVLEHMKDPKRHSEIFEFVWIVQPRDLAKQQGDEKTAMPIESMFVSRKDNVIVEEGGFPEFPFQVPRWTKSSGEKWGRGIGTVVVGVVNGLQTEKGDLIECGNLHNNPPKEILQSFEGEVRVSPGDLNFVTEKGTIRAIEQNALGNFVITKDILEMDKEDVRKAFFLDAFNQLEQLKGDRRNELEIRARLAEGLRKLVTPVSRIQTEWLTGLVIRDIMLLLRNGELGDLPPEMQGKPFKIEYIGRLALELQSAQSTGWLRWVQEGTDIESVVPGTLDNVNIDSGYRRRGITLGVSVDDMASEEEVTEKREARALKEQQALELQMLQMGSQAYQAGTKAPEEGSAAAAVLGSA